MRVGWSANNPGGMNALLPVIRTLLERGDIVEGVATGPAHDMAVAEGLTVSGGYTETPDVLLCGMSLGDSIDKELRGRYPDVPSVYVLDFWSNYANCLTYKGKLFLPTIVCAIDELSKQEAIEDGIPAERIRITGNPYFEHFADAIGVDAEDPHTILFLSQPIRGDAGGAYGFDEHEALKACISALQALPQEYKLSIRLHPRDDAHKFDGLLGPRASLCEKLTLEEALSGAGLVVGMFSTTLLQAAAAGKRIVSYQPGMLLHDPLITNRLGITRKVATEEELAQAFIEYADGMLPRVETPLKMFGPPGAVGRVIAILDELA